MDYMAELVEVIVVTIINTLLYKYARPLNIMQTKAEVISIEGCIYTDT